MRRRKFNFRWIPALVGWSIAAFVALAIHYWSGFSFWAAFAIIVASMMINSFILEAEDNAPGGFNNPFPPEEEASRKRTDEPRNM